MLHKAWVPKGSTGLPIARNNLDESRVAHNENTAHDAHQVTGSFENRKYWEADSGLTAKKRPHTEPAPAALSLPDLRLPQPGEVLDTLWWKA